jgi:hypothetical protein
LLASDRLAGWWGAVHSIRSGQPTIGKTSKAVVKRLVRRSATKVTLEQFNPKKTIELKSSDVLPMHRNVGSGEAYGRAASQPGDKFVGLSPSGGVKKSSLMYA